MVEPFLGKAIYSWKDFSLYMERRSAQLQVDIARRRERRRILEEEAPDVVVIDDEVLYPDCIDNWRDCCGSMSRF